MSEKKHSNARAEIVMTITKASLQDDGTMRWAAVASDTSKDKTGERTSISLFRDWIERVDTGKSVSFLPAPRIPFLGLSHYPSLDGFAEAGITEKMYIDGNRFKVAGIFYEDDDHPVGKALFDAIRNERDLIKRGGDVGTPIRISAAWWDLAHKHGDFVFERKSLDDICPMCQKGTTDKEYLKGQPDHWAATRVPINPRTTLALEEKAMATTRKEDAASIIDEELAEKIDEKAQQRPVGKSETEGSGAMIVKADEGKPETEKANGKRRKKKKGDDKDTYKADAVIERAFGGATSIADAEEFIKAQDLQEQVFTNFDMFMGVIHNAMDDGEVDTVPAIEMAVQDFGERVAALKAAVSDAFLLEPIRRNTMSEQTTDQAQAQAPVQAAATDPTETLKSAVNVALQNPQLDRAGKLQAAQQALETYVEAVKAQVNAVAPPDPGEAIAKSMTPIVEKLDLLLAKLNQQPAEAPQQKSFMPGQPVINNPGAAQEQLQTSPVTGEPSKLTNMIRRSVGIQ